MKRICVDMDEVLADTLAEHIFRYNRDHSEAITKANLEGKWLWEIVSTDRHERLEGYLRSEDFFENLPVMEDSQRVLRELTREFEVYIATAAMEFPNSFGPKYRWTSALSLPSPYTLRLLRRQRNSEGRLLDR
jgi:5'(3')-deoxyribonucleotidase